MSVEEAKVEAQVVEEVKVEEVPKQNGVNGHHEETNGTNGTNETNGTEVNGNHQETNGGGAIDQSKLEPEYFRKVFVGSLSYSTTEESLRNYFSKFGELVDSVIMKESKSGKSRGFGFVSYTKSSMVDELQKARPHKLDGRELETKRATPREESGKPGAESTTKKLFVGAIKDGLTEDNLKEYFGKYGKIEDCVIMKDKDSTKLRGFGFVTFDDYDPVDKIVLEKFHVVNGMSVAVKKALPKDQTNNQGGGGGGGNQEARGGNAGRRNNDRNRGGNNRDRGNNQANGNNNFNNNNMGNNGAGFNGGGMPNFGGNFSGPSNGMPLMSNMNMNNFALFAQKMFEAAATNMNTPFSGGSGLNGISPMGNGGPTSLFDTPMNLGNNRNSGGRGGNNNNRQLNFASDDFEDFDGWSNKNNNMNNAGNGGPMRGNNQRQRNGPYGGGRNRK